MTDTIKRDTNTELPLNPCPRCDGEVKLYSHVSLQDNYNCFAKCMRCKAEFPMPEVWLKPLRGGSVKIHPMSIKKAMRCWNRRTEVKIKN